MCCFRVTLLGPTVRNEPTFQEVRGRTSHHLLSSLLPPSHTLSHLVSIHQVPGLVFVWPVWLFSLPAFHCSGFPGLLPAPSLLLHVSPTDMSWSMWCFQTQLNLRTWNRLQGKRDKSLSCLHSGGSTRIVFLFKQTAVSIPESHHRIQAAPGKSSVIVSSLVWGRRAPLTSHSLLFNAVASAASTLQK